MIVSGTDLAKTIRIKLKKEISRCDRKPKLSVILVGEDEASKSYVRSKEKNCEKVGILSDTIKMDKTATTEEVLLEIEKLNNDNTVDAILVQLPMPKQVDERKILDAIKLDKDVDGFNSENVGKLHLKEECIIPCTPMGIMTLIDSVDYDLNSKEVVVIGRSNLVGKPVAELLTNRNATVTICHSKTKNIKAITKRADLVVVAMGKAKLINKTFLKKDCFVIDVGINRVDGKIVGDCDFDDLVDYVDYITPVPHGVGPMTIVSLLQNTLTLYKKH